jgi:hypothetical protein
LPDFGDIPAVDMRFDAPEFRGDYVAPTFEGEAPQYDTPDRITDAEFPEFKGINLEGLFDAPKPDFSNVGDFEGLPPELDLDEITEALNKVPVPTLTDIPEPTLSEVEIGTPPEVVLPEFNPTVVMNELEEAPDLCAKYVAQYEAALPAMRGFIEDTVQGWMNQYAPNLAGNLATLEGKLIEGMESGNALSEEFETALYNRARTRADDERGRVQTELENGVAKRGFTLPPSVLTAGRVAAHQNAADNIAAQSIELAIERAKMEVQHVQS